MLENRELGHVKLICGAVLSSGIVYLALLFIVYISDMFLVSVDSSPQLAIFRLVLTVFSLLCYPLIGKIKKRLLNRDRIDHSIELSKIDIPKEQKIIYYYLRSLLVLYVIAEIPQIFGVSLAIMAIRMPVSKIHMVTVVFLIVIGILYKAMNFPTNEELDQLIRNQ